MLDAPTYREIPEVIGDEMSVEMPRMANTFCRFGMVASTTPIFGMVSDSESLTQVIHESRADDGGSQSKQSGMNIEAAL
ncbi:hypothetical protein ACPUER_34890, partial [Burkholderia sp. DN3021]|uniref:hypothetical protein n=1 Tax=Burkholderia sp. DN3021 TaxID=3410137 RepID=UPI003C7C9083